MRKRRWLFCIFILLSAIHLLPELSFAEEFELQVIVSKANIRARPDMAGEIVAQVSLGTVLKSDMLAGNWYRVLLPPDDTGTVNRAFIHNSVVRAITKTQPEEQKGEIEKAVEKVEEKTDAPPKSITDESLIAQAQQPASGPERSGRVEFGLRMYGGLDFLFGKNTINDGWQGRNDYRSDSAPLWEGPLSFDGGLEPLKSGSSFGGEFFFNVNPYLGFALGAGYIYAYKEGFLSSTIVSSGSEDVDTFIQKISSPYVKLTVYGGLPLGSRIRLTPYLGVGLYYGAVTSDYRNTYDDPLSLYEYYLYESWTAHGVTFGFHGGLNFELRFMRIIGLYIGAEGLMASFKELTADRHGVVWDNSGMSDSWTEKDLRLWSADIDYGFLGLGVYPACFLEADEPSGTGVGNVKPGLIEISQFRIVVGIAVFFSR